MKQILLFTNASLKSVVNGTVEIITEHGDHVILKGSLLSVSNGNIEVETIRELTMDDLQTGMVIQYDTGEYRLVIRFTSIDGVSDDFVKLVEPAGGGCGIIRRGERMLIKRITRVWERRIQGSLDEWMKIDSNRKLIFEK